MLFLAWCNLLPAARRFRGGMMLPPARRSCQTQHVRLVSQSLHRLTSYLSGLLATSSVRDTEGIGPTSGTWHTDKFGDNGFSDEIAVHGSARATTDAEDRCDDEGTAKGYIDGLPRPRSGRGTGDTATIATSARLPRPRLAATRTAAALPRTRKRKGERIAQVSAHAFRHADAGTEKAVIEHEARAEAAHDRVVRSMRSVGAARLVTSSVD